MGSKVDAAVRRRTMCWMTERLAFHSICVFMERSFINKHFFFFYVLKPLYLVYSFRYPISMLFISKRCHMPDSMLFISKRCHMLDSMLFISKRYHMHGPMCRPKRLVNFASCCTDSKDIMPGFMLFRYSRWHMPHLMYCTSKHSSGSMLFRHMRYRMPGSILFRYKRYRMPGSMLFWYKRYMSVLIPCLHTSLS
jgi:hypothetical protein